MKIVVGIDPSGVHKPLMRLLHRLRFAEPEVVLACALERLPASADVQEANPDDLSQAWAELDAAESHLNLEGVAIRKELRAGSPAQVLTTVADEVEADLIAVQTERKSAFRAFFFGGVSRGLSVGARQSVLFSKDRNGDGGPVRAVFATDHSAYADRAADVFLGLGAKGINAIHIVSAICMSDYVFWAMHFDPYRSVEEREGRLRLEFKTKNEVLAEKFRKAGYEVTHEEPVAPANEAIVHSVEEHRAKLLIMGAQGHGFMERMLIGSVSLHQVLIEPHSVLLLRA